MWPSHGSNPQYLFKAIGMPLPERYLDFSANINPLGPPEQLKTNWAGLFNKILVYPDPYAVRLREKLSRKENIPIESLLIGNGGSELINLTARMLEGKKVLLFQPAFSEYEQACRNNGCQIEYHQLAAPDFELDLDQLRPKLREADAVFFCNPSNPTGIHYPRLDILSILDECEKNGTLLVLDEAFYDFLEEYESIIPYIDNYRHLIVIRSMTKMFAIPGIRLGYLAAKPETITELSKWQSHWNTNAIALAAGELCLQDDYFVKQTQTFIANERSQLFIQLKGHEYLLSSSKVNFYLLRDPLLVDQYELFLFLLKKGIIPRHTLNFHGLEGKWLRFAIKNSVENERLMEVLNEWRQNHR